jgi:curved DNA-binding protein
MKQSTSAEITKAFKDLAKKHHPDRGGTQEKFQEINEAHDTLKSSQKRHDYDSMRKFGGGTGGAQHPFFNEDIFGDIFSGFGKGETWTSTVASTSQAGTVTNAYSGTSNRATGV